MPTFPSTEWFETVRNIVNNDEGFRRLGTVDARVGIKVGDALCIIEAMKLMNEIESDADGKVVKILVENGKPVEYNQILFQIEKT